MRYFLIAGEASGDMHGARLMAEIRKADHQAIFMYFGGDLMEEQGGVLFKHYREMAFMGVIPVLMNIRSIQKNFRKCETELLQFRPDVLILIDYPGFNLRMAKFAKQNNIHTAYYISPKIWAWKTNRVKQVKKYIDQMFTIFPFETGFYNKFGYPVTYIGNPVYDIIREEKEIPLNFEQFCSDNYLTDKPIVALLAGSRKQEISKCLPLMTEAASRFDGYQIVVAGAPGIEADFYKQYLNNASIPVIFDQTYKLVQQAELAVVNSGTATLETALIGTPQVVVYHVLFGRLAYWVKNIVIKTKYISLVNLVAERELVKELIAHLFTADNVANEINRIFTDNNYRNDMLKGYADIKAALGEPGTARRTAEKIQQLLAKTNHNCS